MSGHVLWVEPGKRDFTALRQSLAAATLKIVRVETLAEALEVLSSLPMEAVVLDSALGDANGTACVRLIRDQSAYVPLVALIDDQAAAAELIDAGAEEVMGRTALPAVVIRTLKHAMDRARWSAQTRQLLRIHPDVALVIDQKEHVLFANGPAERMLGRNIVGRKLPMSVGPGVRRGDLPPELGSRPAEVRVAEMTWGARRAAVVFIRELDAPNVNIDERLTHLSRLASIGQLAASVTHEANNLSMGVLANLALLEHQLGGHSHEVIDESIQTVKRMSSMLADLCAFSRRDTGVEWVDINEVVTTACRWTKKHLHQQARLVTALNDVPPIAADATELRQALVNLLLNAVKAIEKRGGSDNRIVIETRVEGDKLIVTVEDTGAGVPSDLKKQIFEPFFTTNASAGGTGLGLAITSDIVRRLGGEIEVESLDTGSLFKIVLPQETPLEAQI
jgi:signal transduction histidine kinase